MKNLSEIQETGLGINCKVCMYSACAGLAKATIKKDYILYPSQHSSSCKLTGICLELSQVHARLQF